MTFKEARQRAVTLLAGHGIEDARSDTDILMEAFFGIRPMDILMRGDREMTLEEEERLSCALEKRCRRIPVQHITGEQYFYGHMFSVNEDVLIPRQDTELLVRLADDRLKRMEREAENGKERSKSEKVLRVLDLCTGSGCIGISLKLEHPNAAATLSDLSEKALKVAEKNALDLNAPVELNRGDLFEGLTGEYDLIVSNPPYIASAQIETLQEEVRLHDPRMALDGSSDGLVFYRRIAAQAGGYLRPFGALMMEIGYDQGEALEKLLSESGWNNIQIHKDLAGLDRVVTAQKG